VKALLTGALPSGNEPRSPLEDYVAHTQPRFRGDDERQGSLGSAARTTSASPHGIETGTARARRTSRSSGGLESTTRASPTSAAGPHAVVRSRSKGGKLWLTTPTPAAEGLPRHDRPEDRDTDEAGPCLIAISGEAR